MQSFVWRLLRILGIGLVLGGLAFVFRFKAVAQERIDEVRSRATPVLKKELADKGFALGDPAFIRIFKETDELELWLKPAGSNKYLLWKTWPIAAKSGKLGPKKKEGDMQAPEGFYEVVPKALNPRSSYHLSFNIGYPNAYDQAHKRTGGLIMVHGNKVSIGCFAMTDPVIEKIYLIVEAALKKDKAAVPVHVFPFRMTPERMLDADEHDAFAFWEELLPAYEVFENERRVPKVSGSSGKYELLD